MNQKELSYWVWLSSIKGLGPVTARKLLKDFSSPKAVFNADPDALLQAGSIKPAIADQLKENRQLEDAEQKLAEYEAKGIGILTLDDPFYPSALQSLKDAPILLYYKGILQTPGKTVGIVGPRKCSRDARALSIQLSEAAAVAGLTIVSGLAIGIDTYAHTAAIKKGSYTIAVLGNGVDICYPKEHIDVYEMLCQKGLILSELPPGTKPASYLFPKRNRIIAALSDELYVIDPGHKSGSLITAEYAQKYGKQVHILRPKETT